MKEENWIPARPDEKELKFGVYTNYLSGLSYILDSTYNGPGKQWNSINFDVIRQIQRQDINTDEVKRFLNNAWNSERILNAPKDHGFDKSFIKFANHWSPVLAYYSIFLAFQGLFLVLGWNKVLEHKNFLLRLSSRIKRSSLPLIYPWTYLCDGCAILKEENYNFKVIRQEVYDYSSLSNPEHADRNIFLAKTLRTTRVKQEEFEIERYKKEGKIRNKDGSKKTKFNKLEKSKISSDLGPTNLFHFLYRLRLRSNYEDADIFFIGNRNSTTINEYFNSIINITNYVMFLVESMVRERVGKGEFSSYINIFKKASGDYASGIVYRSSFY